MLNRSGRDLPIPTKRNPDLAQIPIIPLDLPIQREHLRSTDYGLYYIIRLIARTAFEEARNFRLGAFQAINNFTEKTDKSPYPAQYQQYSTSHRWYNHPALIPKRRALRVGMISIRRVGGLSIWLSN